MKPAAATSPSTFFTCLPDSAGKVAALTFAIGLIFALAFYVTHSLPQDPNLQHTYYCIFGVGLAATGIAFILSNLVAICKDKTASADGESDTPCKVVLVSLAIGLIFALAMYVTHSLPQNPGLQTTYYTIFGCGIAITSIPFVLACIKMLQNQSTTPPAIEE